MTGQREDSIKELVRASYEDPRTIARYTTVGLWPAEETLVLDHVPDQARILDLGCGAGRTSIPLAEMGLRVTGVDLSAGMVAVAREQARLAGVSAEFEVMDSMELRFAEGSFDAVLYSYNGIELAPGRAGKRRVVEEAWRVLRPAGSFIFSTHSLFAVNAFALHRLKGVLLFLAGRLLGLPVREQELGERFVNDQDEEVKYLQVLPPFAWLRMLADVGFEVVLYNTRKRLEEARKWGFPRPFEDGERFYVGRKN